jgi:hypothetical protein
VPLARNRGQSARPGEREEVERVAVHGWSGGPVKEIMNVIELHPIGPPIPSSIEEFDKREMEKSMRKYPSSN